MKQQLLHTIRAHDLWSPGHKVAVAVSGGADSLALLLLLAQTQAVHGAVLSVISIDHGLHGHSRSWSAHALAVAASLGVPGSIRAVAPLGESELAARDARYSVFDALEVDRVALAHHRRDQAETVLIHLLRGTGPRGLGGMPRRRGRYVRPLLDLEPRTLLDLLTAAGIESVIDPANEDARYLRARVRHTLLPMLDSLRQGSVASLARSATYSAADDTYLRHLADQIPLEPEALRSAPAVLARRRLEAAIGPVTMGQIEAVMAVVRRGTGTVQLGGGRSVVVSSVAVQLVIEPD